MSEEEPTPTRLLRQASEGRRTAIGLLIELYEPLLVSAVQRYLGSSRFRAEGEDLLQDIRMALVKGLPRLRQRSRRSLAAWLKKVVQNRIRDWERVRQAQRRKPERSPARMDGISSREPADAAPTPSQVLVRREEFERLDRAIEAVPERYRALLKYIVDANPTPSEVARFLAKEPDAARKFAGRALQHLRRILNTTSRPAED
ncbi:MAG: sigma-70 family RNA polymerase sigma factor [Planctomycetes bacterium]|nr:sigma-70 family RNA polymerase sigma factor [Planctomycetota bacterium]